MRLSRLADFAVVVMTHVAQNDCAGHTATAVAEATRLPAPTVAKVLARLCRERLLVSMRGRKGGYALARAAAATSVGSIVAALDGPVALTRCLEPGAKRCEVEDVCPSRIGLHRINVAVRNALDEVSLADIAALTPIARPSASPEALHRLP
jgi:FeS assembly SUF system regulator